VAILISIFLIVFDLHWSIL